MEFFIISTQPPLKAKEKWPINTPEFSKNSPRLTKKSKALIFHKLCISTMGLIHYFFIVSREWDLDICISAV